MTSFRGLTCEVCILVKLRAFIFSPIIHLYWGYQHRGNYATAANILKVMNFSHFVLFEFTYPVCFEIHITMNALCWLYSCVKIICQRCQMSSGPHGSIFDFVNSVCEITIPGSNFFRLLFAVKRF